MDAIAPEAALEDCNLTKLIQMYEEREVLWNLTHESYHKKEIRNKLLTENSDALGLHGPLDAKKKIRGLRTVFTWELKKVQDSKRSGAGMDELYVSKFKHFKSLMFLQPHIVTKETKSNMDNIVRQTLGTEVEPTSDTEKENQGSRPTASKSSKKRKLAEENNLLQVAQSILTQPKDACHSFAMFVASEMRLIQDPVKFRSIKRRITNILVEQDTEQGLLEFLSSGATLED